MTAVRCKEIRTLLSRTNRTAWRIAKRRAQWTRDGDPTQLLETAARRLERSVRNACKNEQARCPLRSERTSTSGCTIADDGGRKRVKGQLLEVMLDQMRSERRTTGGRPWFGSDRDRRRRRNDARVPSVDLLRTRVRELQERTTSEVFPGVEERHLDCVLLAAEMLATGEIDDPIKAVDRAAATCGLPPVGGRSGRSARRLDRLLDEIAAVRHTLGLESW